MPSLPITPKYEPGPEIGISTPMRMTFSCACAAKIAQANARIAPLSASFMDSLPRRCGQCTKAARFPQGSTARGHSVLRVARRSRKRDGVAHVGETGNVGDGALQAEAEAGVRHRAV